MVRRMCDCFEQQGWKLKSVTNHCLKRVVWWRKRYMGIVGGMESLTKLIQRCPRCPGKQGFKAGQRFGLTTVEVGCH